MSAAQCWVSNHSKKRRLSARDEEKLEAFYSCSRRMLIPSISDRNLGVERVSEMAPGAPEGISGGIQGYWNPMQDDAEVHNQVQVIQTAQENVNKKIRRPYFFHCAHYDGAVDEDVFAAVGRSGGIQNV